MIHYELWHDPDEPYQYQGDETHCAGALIALNKTDEIQDNFLLRLAIMFGWLNIDNLNMSAHVPTLDEWVNKDE